MGRGRQSEGSTAEIARKRPERPWTAARTMEVLRRCPLAIAQRLCCPVLRFSFIVLSFFSFLSSCLSSALCRTVFLLLCCPVFLLLCRPVFLFFYVVLSYSLCCTVFFFFFFLSYCLPSLFCSPICSLFCRPAFLDFPFLFSPLRSSLLDLTEN